MTGFMFTINFFYVAHGTWQEDVAGLQYRPIQRPDMYAAPIEFFGVVFSEIKKEGTTLLEKLSKPTWTRLPRSENKSTSAYKTSQKEHRDVPPGHRTKDTRFIDDGLKESRNTGTSESESTFEIPDWSKTKKCGPVFHKSTCDQINPVAERWFRTRDEFGNKTHTKAVFPLSVRIDKWDREIENIQIVAENTLPSDTKTSYVILSSDHIKKRQKVIDPETMEEAMRVDYYCKTTMVPSYFSDRYKEYEDDRSLTTPYFLLEASCMDAPEYPKGNCVIRLKDWTLEEIRTYGNLVGAPADDIKEMALHHLHSRRHLRALSGLEQNQKDETFREQLGWDENYRFGARLDCERSYCPDYWGDKCWKTELDGSTKYSSADDKDTLKEKLILSLNMFIILDGSFCKVMNDPNFNPDRKAQDRKDTVNELKIKPNYTDDDCEFGIDYAQGLLKDANMILTAQMKIKLEGEMIVPPRVIKKLFPKLDLTSSIFKG